MTHRCFVHVLPCSRVGKKKKKPNPYNVGNLFMLVVLCHSLDQFYPVRILFLLGRNIQISTPVEK